jgi:hypothetical protein
MAFASHAFSFLNRAITCNYPNYIKPLLELLEIDHINFITVGNSQYVIHSDATETQMGVIGWQANSGEGWAASINIKKTPTILTETLAACLAINCTREILI